MLDWIEAANTTLCAAFAASDEAALAACYTPAAQVFPTGMEIVSGTAAIEAFWKGAFGGPAETLTLITAEAEQHGDTAIESGRIEFFGANGQIVDTSKYIVVWKHVGGEWKIHRDIFNSNTPVNPEN